MMKQYSCDGNRSRWQIRAIALPDPAWAIPCGALPAPARWRYAVWVPALPGAARAEQATICPARPAFAGARLAGGHGRDRGSQHHRRPAIDAPTDSHTPTIRERGRVGRNSGNEGRTLCRRTRTTQWRIVRQYVVTARNAHYAGPDSLREGVRLISSITG